MPFILSRWWTPPGCTDDCQILLRPLSVPEWQEFQRMATDPDVEPIEYTKYILERGVANWRGFKEIEGGDDLEFSAEHFTRLPNAIQSWALKTIQGLSITSEEEEKNSASQSMSATKKPKAKARSTARTVSTGGIATKPIRRRPRSSKTT